MFEKFKAIPSHMDYEGQKKAEKVFQSIIVIAAITGFIIGHIYQQFSITVYFLLVGSLLSCLLTLPPWPMYRRHPISWLKPLPEDTAVDRPSTPVTKSIKKK